METFNLDLSKLTPVAEDDRVKGNWYVVADNIGNYGTVSIRRWHSNNDDMCQIGTPSIHWKLWFAIPSGLPGFPKDELPDEFELNKGEWLDASGIVLTYNQTFKRKLVTLPTISIPSGTKSEQLAELRKILEKLENK